MTLKLAGFGSVTSPNVDAGTQTLTLGTLALANGSGLAGNYQIASSGNTGTVTAATLTLSGSKVYDSTTTFVAADFGIGGTINTGINGQTLVLTGSGSVGSANVSTGTQTLTLNSLTLTNGTGTATNYQIASTGNTGVVTAAVVTLNGAKSYDSGTTFISSDFGLNGTIFTGVGLQTLTVTGGSGSVGGPNVIDGVQTLNTGTLTLANGPGRLGGLASNYMIATTGNTGVINPATISLAGTKVYDANAVFTAADFGTDGTIDTGINGETLNVTGSGTVLSSNVSAGTQFLFSTGLSLTNGSSLASNYRISLLRNTGVITPATLSYVANPSTQYDGVAFPTFTGTVTGFVNNQSLATATAGTPQFTTTATPSSPPGSYAIDGSGLTADHGNYVFVQAAGNATALTLDAAPLPPPNVPPPTPPTTTVNITFQNSNPGTNPIHVSFTPNSATANNNNDVNTTALPPDVGFTHKKRL